MQFLTAQQEVAIQLGLDISNTDTATAIKRWLNTSYQDIVGEYNWSWLKAFTTKTMELDYSTGTVSATTGSATITFSDAIATSQVGRSIQFSSSTSWYQIATHTAGTATATITPVYAPTTNLVSGTFTIRTINYSLGSDVEYVYAARSTTFPWAIEIVDRTRYNQFTWWSNLVGQVRGIIPNGYDASGNWTFTTYPFPNDTYVLEIYYIKKVAELTGNTDAPLFPARFDSIWLEGAKAYGYGFLDDSRAGAAKTEFKDKVKAMFSRDNPMQNEMYVLRPFDDQPSVKGINFPPNYGPNMR